LRFEVEQASRGLSAIAELLVLFTVSLYRTIIIILLLFSPVFFSV